MEVDIISLEFVLVIYITNLLGVMDGTGLGWGRHQGGIWREEDWPLHAMTLKN